LYYYIVTYLSEKCKQKNFLYTIELPPACGGEKP
jgi:hypothetical protein